MITYKKTTKKNIIIYCSQIINFIGYSLPNFISQTLVNPRIPPYFTINITITNHNLQIDLQYEISQIPLEAPRPHILTQTVISLPLFLQHQHLANVASGHLYIRSVHLKTAWTEMVSPQNEWRACVGQATIVVVWVWLWLGE